MYSVFEHTTVFKNSFFLRLENINLSLNPLRHFVKVYWSSNLELNDIAHCFVVTELCGFARVKPWQWIIVKMKLSTDIEKNTLAQCMLTPSKTIGAPYSQGNDLDKMQDNNVLQWVYILWFTTRKKDQFCEWPHSNNPFENSAYFKFIFYFPSYFIPIWKTSQFVLF